MVSTDEGRTGGGRSRRSGRSRLLRLLLVVGGLLGVGAVAAGVAFYLAFVRDLPDIDSVEDYRPPLASVVLDRHGERVGAFFHERRRLIPLTEVPQHVVRAFIAAEDSHFYEHSGIDYASILRAAWANLRAGEVVEGASTITQQTVKGLLLSPERKFRRKIREVILARNLEQQLTKQEILYLYLNQIYFGSGAYGLREAARSYYGKEVADLTVGEAAQLAGLPKAPTSYSPRRNPERAERRRRYVLSRMLDEGFITQKLYDEALAERPKLSDQPWTRTYSEAAYFSEQVRRYLFDELGGDVVLEGGLRIETTLDMKLQSGAVAALRQGLQDLDHRQGYRGPERHVESAELPALLVSLAEENGLAASPEASDAPAGTADAKARPGGDATRVAGEGVEAQPAGAPPEADAAARLRAALAEGPLRGVVTEVDPKNRRARIAFGPSESGTVHLEDVSWAHEVNPALYPRPVKAIEKVFAPGDVAHFALAEADAGAATDDPDAAGADEVRVTLHQEPLVQGALLSMDVRSGDVLALVGGYDFSESEFDRVTQARRQPGSAFKPLVYGAALSMKSDSGQQLYTPASIIYDRPKVYRDYSTGFVWKPKNYGREFYGPITLRYALAKSINTAAVHLCDEVGVGNVIAYARRLGIESPLEPSLGLALGTSGVSLLELTRAYAVFPAGGQRVVPRFIRRVTDREGNVLLENVALGNSFEEPAEQTPASEAPAVVDVAAGPGALQTAPSPIVAEREQLIPEEQAYLMSDMLRAVVNEGTGRRVAALGRPLAGKTGTTNDQADAWFLGFSPEIATGVWVGHDESRFLGVGETGSRAASPIWIDYMRVALADKPKRDFALPESIVFARIDRETGLLATNNTKKTVFQAFIAGTEPTETADNRRTNQDALRDLREDSLSDDQALQLMKLDGF
jgi:penicillin-binding protein 1A